MKIVKLTVHDVFSSDGYKETLVRAYTSQAHAREHATKSGHYSTREVQVFVDEASKDVYTIVQTGIRLDETEDARKRREVIARLSADDRKILGLENE